MLELGKTGNHQLQHKLVALSPSQLAEEEVLYLFKDDDLKRISKELIPGELTRIQKIRLKHLSRNYKEINKSVVQHNIKLNKWLKSERKARCSNLWSSVLYLLTITASIGFQIWFVMNELTRKVEEMSDRLQECSAGIGIDLRNQINLNSDGPIASMKEYQEQYKDKFLEECNAQELWDEIERYTFEEVGLMRSNGSATSLDAWYAAANNQYQLLRYHNFGLLLMILWGSGMLFTAFQTLRSQININKLSSDLETGSDLLKILRLADSDSSINRNKTEIVFNHIGTWPRDKEFLDVLQYVSSSTHLLENILELNQAAESPKDASKQLVVEDRKRLQKRRTKRRRGAASAKPSKKTPSVDKSSFIKSEMKWADDSNGNEYSFVSVQFNGKRAIVFRASISKKEFNRLESKYHFNLRDIHAAFNNGFVRQQGQVGFKKIVKPGKSFEVEVKMRSTRRLFLWPAGISEKASIGDFKVHREYFMLRADQYLARKLHRKF